MPETGSCPRASRRTCWHSNMPRWIMDVAQLDLAAESPAVYGAEEATEQIIKRLETEMKAAAKELEFERAAALRNRIRALKLKELELKPEV